MYVPDEKWTAGQVEWVLWYPIAGRPPEPTPAFRAKLVYLRKAGIPFSEEERFPGSGRNILYNFYHLAELAVALELIDHGVKPGDAATLLTTRRQKFRSIFAKAYNRRGEGSKVNLPATAMAHGLFLEVTVDYARDEPSVRGLQLLTPIEAMELIPTMGRAVCSRFIIAISALLDRTVSRALEAPELRRGRSPVTPRRSTKKQ